MHAAKAKAGAPLSAGEKKALTHAACGLTDRAIAARMGSSIASVSTQLSRAYAKLRADNRTHAVVLGLVRGDIKIPVGGAATDPCDWFASVAVEDGGEAP